VSESGARRSVELPYRARARLADNLFVHRQRVGYSQEVLGERAMVSAGRIGQIENGQAIGMLDTYVRLAGSLSATLDDLLAGISWTPCVVEFELDPGYEVKFDPEA
jgi:transcriptional regulator with XRE-family HTH domain